MMMPFDLHVAWSLQSWRSTQATLRWEVLESLSSLLLDCRLVYKRLG